MKSYQETIQFIAEVRAHLLAFPGAPMGTYISEAAVAVIYNVAEEVVYTDAQMATLARRAELTAV
jgi:hypothetical protein